MIRLSLLAVLTFAASSSGQQRWCPQSQNPIFRVHDEEYEIPSNSSLVHFTMVPELPPRSQRTRWASPKRCRLPRPLQSEIGKSLQSTFFSRPLRDCEPENFHLFERKPFFGLAMLNQSKQEFKALQKPQAKSKAHAQIMSSLSNMMEWHDMEFVFMDSEIRNCLKKRSSMGGDFNFKYNGTSRDSTLKKFRVQCTTLKGSSRQSRQILTGFQISVLLFKSVWRANEYEATVTDGPQMAAPPTQRWKPQSERREFLGRKNVRHCWQVWCHSRPVRGCEKCEDFSTDQRTDFMETRLPTRQTQSTPQPRIVTKKRKMTLLDRSKIFEDSERELREAINRDYGGYIEAYEADLPEQSGEETV